MFDNVGEKIMKFAGLFFFVGFFGGIMAAIVLWCTRKGVALGFLALFEAVLAWGFSLLIYAFGKLVDDVDTTNRELRKIAAIQRNVENE